MKKLFATLLALVMMLSVMSVTAFATTTPAPVAGSNHTYTAYKIFSGTQTADEDDATLGAVVWGDGIDAENFPAALKDSTAFGEPNAFADCETAADVAKAMKDWADSSNMAKAFAKLAEDYVVEAKGVACENGITTLDAGYYLVVDTTETVEPTDAYNVALLQLTKKSTFDIVQKNSVPGVKKEVSDEGALSCENTEDGHVHNKDCYTWADSNNVALGDTVHYKIETAVPAEASEYEYYFFIVNDTLSDGLTYTADSIKVYINDVLATADDYTVKVDGQNIQVALVDAIANAGKSVVVTYDAVLNTDAVIGVEGNPNEVTVKYSNNPNEDFKPGDIPSDGFPKDETHKPTGETPKDYTITYVSKINVYKVDENKNPLQGAEFTLTGNTLNQVIVMTEKFTEATGADAVYYKLKNGTYTTEEPVTQDYMKEAEAGATAGYVVDNTYSGDDKVVIGETTYRPYVPASDSGKTVYILVKANADLYDLTNMYKREWVSETQTASGETLKVVGTVDENGVVSFVGLPAGEYTLSETVVPNGYNPIPDIEFTTTWSAPETVKAGNEECTWDVATGDKSGVHYNADADAFEITIVNQKGATLPETGGIGTTIFYIVGGLLLVGAAVMLVSKKRMESEK